jgi:hypothetical protein
VREISAGFRTRLVHKAEISVEEYTAIFGGSQNSSPRSVGIGYGVQLHNLLGFQFEMLRDGFDLQLINCHNRVAAAVRAGGAVYLLLYFCCQYVKGFDPVMMGRKISPEIPILRLLGDSQLPDLYQIRNHAFQHTADGAFPEIEDPWDVCEIMPMYL